jgi:hypothetical protein
MMQLALESFGTTDDINQISRNGSLSCLVKK